MRYFIDTEFIEGFRKPLFEKKRHFIDLISIGMVAEDGREYYAICNEFDLDYIWDNKDTWVKDNVLKPLHTEMCQRESVYAKTYHWELFTPFTKRSIRRLLKWQGKSQKQIAEEISDFTCVGNDISFYGYYADYDWVVFCSLFGRMIDLPKGFPMYCYDLKQLMDEKGLAKEWKRGNCPDPEGEHNAIVDARWNYKLFKQIQQH